MGFQVFLHKNAQRKLDKIVEKELKERLQDAFKLLSSPFSLDTIKIKGEEGTYRTRIGRYRILEVIEGNSVYIVDFDHRGKAYKKF